MWEPAERKCKWGFGGWIDVGVLGGGWTRESGGGRVRGGWIDEPVYLVSVGVECVCVKGSSVLVLVLGWTQCLPQGAGAPPAMPRGHTTGFPKKLGGRASGGGVGCNRLVPNKDIDKGTLYISFLSVIAKHWRRAFSLT